MTNFISSNPYIITLPVLFLVLILILVFRYKIMKQPANKTAPSAAYPTSPMNIVGFITGEGPMVPTSYETGVAMKKELSFGVDTAKCGEGFSKLQISSGQDYDPIRR